MRACHETTKRSVMDTQAACKDRGATMAIAKAHKADMMLVGVRLLNDRFEAGSVESIRSLDALGLRFSNGTDDTRPVAAAVGGSIGRPEPAIATGTDS
jgi:cation transport ATPase